MCVVCDWFAGGGRLAERQGAGNVARRKALYCAANAKTANWGETIQLVIWELLPTRLDKRVLPTNVLTIVVLMLMRAACVLACCLVCYLSLLTDLPASYMHKVRRSRLSRAARDAHATPQQQHSA